MEPLVIERMVLGVEFNYNGRCDKMRLTRIRVHDDGRKMIPFGYDMVLSFDEEFTKELVLEFPMIFKFTITEAEDQERILLNEDSFRVERIEEIKQIGRYLEETETVLYKYVIMGVNFTRWFRFDGSIQSYMEPLPLKAGFLYDVKIEQIVKESKE